MSDENRPLVKPYSDIFIKYLFGSERNKHLLLSFLNSVLQAKGFDKIVEVVLKNPFNIKEFSADKESIIDIKATDENYRIYDIEMQATSDPNFINRSLYYWARLYGSQLEEGEKYKALKPVICINIVTFEIFDNQDKIHSCFVPKKINSNEILTDQMAIDCLELSKIKVESLNDGCKLNKWLYFIKNEGGDDPMLKTLLEKDLDIQQADEQYKRFNDNKKLRDVALAREMYRRDKISAIDAAEEKGIEKGIEQKAIEDAKRFKALGVDIAIIAEATGLSKEQIEKL